MAAKKAAKKKHNGKKSAGDGVGRAITNRRAGFDYDLKDNYQAGLVLSGAEVKSLRMNHGHLRGAYVNLKDGEAWLFNSTITPLKTNAAHLPEEIQTRSRKLLLKHRELAELAAAKNQGLTIIPTRILTGKHFIKIEIAVGKGKKKFDKRQSIKKRDEQRNLQRLVR